MKGLRSKYHTVDEWVPDHLSTKNDVMGGLNMVEARLWSKHLSQEMVVKLEVEDLYMLYNNGRVNELKRMLVYKAIEIIEEDLEVTSITMTKVY